MDGLRWTLLGAVLSSACLASPLAVTGRVVEQHSGAVLKRVRVLLSSSGKRGFAKAVETGADGQFSFPGAPDGKLRLDIVKEGYGSAVLFAAAPRETPIVVRLPKYGAISGRVIDQAGKPMPGMLMMPLARRHGVPTLQRVRGAPPGFLARTDDRGVYRLFGLPPGEYAIGMSGSGSATADEHGVTLVPGGGQMRLFRITSGEELADGDATVSRGTLGIVTGRVVGLGATGPTLLTLAPFDLPSISAAQTLAGADGGFRFEGIPIGNYNLFVSGPTQGNGGYGGPLGKNPLFARAPVVSSNDGTEATVSVSNEPGKALQFQLRDSGSPDNPPCASGGTIHLTSIEEWGAQISRTVDIDSKAPRALSDLAPARYVISVTGLGDLCFYAGDPILDLTGSAAESVALGVAPPSSIRGVLKGGPKLAEFLVLLWPSEADEGGPAVVSALPDDQGRFVIEGMPPGRYRIGTTSLAQWNGQQWAPEEGSMVEVDLLPASATNLELPVMPARSN